MCCIVVPNRHYRRIADYLGPVAVNRTNKCHSPKMPHNQEIRQGECRCQ
jgi:hypothetical protein